MVPNPPAPGRDGLAPQGSRWESGYVVRATSLGPGVPVTVSHPLQGPPRRAIGDGTAKLSGGKLIVTPNQAPAGQSFNLTLEF